MSRLSRILAAALLAALTLTLTLSIALAHESREIGKYRFVVGWVGEPAYQGQKNGIDLTVTNIETNQPVEGLEKTLKAEIMFGGQKREVALRAVFRQPGKYTADIVPSKDGDYRFRFFGDIAGQQVNETFDSANGKFNSVQKIEPLYFPEAPTSVETMSQALQAAEQKATAAQAAAQSSQTFGILGLVVGALGLVVGGVALLSSRRAAAGAAMPSPRATAK